MNKKKNKTGDMVVHAPKLRNWLAIHAHFRKGAGSHGDEKKRNSRRACRNFKWTS